MKKNFEVKKEDLYYFGIGIAAAIGIFAFTSNGDIAITFGFLLAIVLLSTKKK